MLSVISNICPPPFTIDCAESLTGPSGTYIKSVSSSTRRNFLTYHGSKAEQVVQAGEESNILYRFPLWRCGVEELLSLRALIRGLIIGLLVNFITLHT